jgi:hypothetical protein
MISSIKRATWAVLLGASLLLLMAAPAMAAELSALEGDISLESLTLAALLTTAGSTIAAGIITGLVSVLTGLVAAIKGHEAQAAAVLAAVLVLLLAVQAVQTAAMAVGVPLLLAVVLGWYAITRLAMSIYDDVTSKPASLTAQAGGDPATPNP